MTNTDKDRNVGDCRKMSENVSIHFDCSSQVLYVVDLSSKLGCDLISQHKFFSRDPMIYIMFFWFVRFVNPSIHRRARVDG